MISEGRLGGAVDRGAPGRPRAALPVLGAAMPGYCLVDLGTR